MPKASLKRPRRLFARGTSLHQPVTFVLPFQLGSTSTFWCWLELLFANRAELPGMEGSSGACHVACTDVPFIPMSHKALSLTGVKQITQVEHLILYVPLFSYSCLIYSQLFTPLLLQQPLQKTQKNGAEARNFLLKKQNLQKQHLQTKQKCRTTELLLEQQSN